MGRSLVSTAAIGGRLEGMSYQRTSLGLDAAEIASQAQELYSAAKPGLRAGLQILKDPAFPEVTQLVMELREETKKEAPPGAPPEPGVGLRHAVPPLKAFLYYRRHPGVVIAGAAGAVGLTFLLGYAAGKRRRR